MVFESRDPTIAEVLLPAVETAMARHRPAKHVGMC